MDSSRPLTGKTASANHRAPLDAGRPGCFHIWRHLPGASEPGRWAELRMQQRYS
jgi:hypothetical protein